MAAYSGTPLPQRLGIKPGQRVALLQAPPQIGDLLEPLPEGVHAVTTLRGAFDVIVAFFTERQRYERRLPTLRRALDDAGGLWVAWPKRAAKRPTDLDENVVRELGLAAGLVDNKVCAIDDTWSALRLVVRLADRTR